MSDDVSPKFRPQRDVEGVVGPYLEALLEGQGKYKRDDRVNPQYRRAITNILTAQYVMETALREAAGMLRIDGHEVELFE